MPRPPRILHPGAWYHITARGIERRPTFKDSRDRSHFVKLLAELVERYAVRLHAFVLMDNHYHLLIELSRPNLSRAIQWLNVSYSVWFNRRHQRCGYLFQGRFKSIVVDPREWGLGLSAYIHLNPVRVGRRGLSKVDRQRARAGAGALPEASEVRRRIVSLRSYRWSSYRPYIGLESCPPWLDIQPVLDAAGGLKKQRENNYRNYVEDQVRNGLAAQPWEELKEQLLLGGHKFVRDVKNAFRATGQREERWSRETVDLQEVIRSVEKARGMPFDDFGEKHGDPGRDLILYLARRTTGLKVSDLAKEFGLRQGENVSMAVKRYQKRIDKDKTERQIATAAAKMLFVIL